MSTSDPTDLRRRALRAVNEDGLTDFGFGLVLLLAAGYFALVRFSDASHSFTGVWAILPMMVMLSVRAMRRRYTYPRIGYAKPKPGSLQIALAVGLLVLMLAGLGGFFFFKSAARETARAILLYLPAFLGLGGAGVLVAFGVRTGFARYHAYGAVALAALVAAYALRLETAFVFMVPTGAVGAVMLVGGIAGFIRFLRTHPKPVEGEPDAA